MLSIYCPQTCSAHLNPWDRFISVLPKHGIRRQNRGPINVSQLTQQLAFVSLLMPSLFLLNPTNHSSIIFCLQTSQVSLALMASIFIRQKTNKQKTKKRKKGRARGREGGRERRREENFPTTQNWL